MSTARELRTLARQLNTRLKLNQQVLTTAESCTGGMIAKLVTDIAGSSEVFELGFVTYSNAAKQAQLGVDERVLNQFGAVSEQTVLAMAEGALRVSGANWSIAVSGIAGPGGASEGKPVGTVWLAWGERGVALSSERIYLPGNRDAVRRASAAIAMRGLLTRLDG
ncbi:MAG: CinA family protein [Pseudomonadota bacterium]